MLSFLPPHLLGIINLLLITLNTVIHFILIFIPSCLKIVLTPTPLEPYIARFVIRIAINWIDMNQWILWLTVNIEWDIDVSDELEEDKWYLVISNHQSWADVLVNQRAFVRKIPFLKFFLKKQMIWLPLLGITWWAMDMPFLNRYSNEYLKAHPEKKGEDLKRTKKSCEKFKNIPTSVIVFAEGTRYTEQKSKRQESPYHYLLKPKAGGISLALSTLGDYLTAIINVTIVYSEQGFWTFLCGQSKKIVVRAEMISIPGQFKQGDSSEKIHEPFKNWVNSLWHEKDELIHQIKTTIA
ncbi:acetyltransferase [Deltaproteobacteria bacterium TL4]